MIAYRDEALNILAAYPESPGRAAMEDLVHYAIDRKY
jgi:octaprenyl-diphosphate synthase